MLFKRSAELRIGDTLICGLDMAFFIEKTLSREPNTCELKIWNLSEKNRRFLAEQKRIPIVLMAGYENATGLLFKGDLAEAFSGREGPNWVTTIRSGDGLVALQTARINKTFKAGTPLVDVLKELAKSLGISCGDALSLLDKHKRLIANPTIPLGKAMYGNSFCELEKALASVGLTASVQDSALQIINSQMALEGTAVVLSASTGLIGSPEMSNSGVLRCRSLLQHDIFPGRKIQVKAQEIKETLFRVERVKFIGETAGQDWYVDIEAKRI